MKPFERQPHPITLTAAIVAVAVVVLVSRIDVFAARAGHCRPTPRMSPLWQRRPPLRRSKTTAAPSGRFALAFLREPSSTSAGASPRHAGPTGDGVDRSQGVQLATPPGAGPLLGHGLRLAQGGSQAQCPPAVRDEDRRAGHPLHPRPVAPPQRDAADHHARVAGLGVRAAQGHRSAHRSDRLRRRAEDAFDVVIPSMPGYGFSGKPDEQGWGPSEVARAWDVLMKRLGYTRYVAQGGDWGSVVAEGMARQAPGDCSASTSTCLPPCRGASRRRSERRPAPAESVRQGEGRVRGARPTSTTGAAATPA